MPANKGSISFVLKTGLVLILVAGASFAVVSGLRPDAVVEPVVRGKAVDPVPGSVKVHADGDLRALRAEASGKVVWCEALDPHIPFKEGDVLVRLDTTELERMISDRKREFANATERRKIRLANSPERKLAERQLADAERMHALHTISDQDLERAKRELQRVATEQELADFEWKVAEQEHRNAMEALELLLQKKTITAPFDGTVKDAMVWKGALIDQGATVATIYSNLRVVAAQISEEVISKVKIGDRAKVRLLSFPDEQFDATVLRMVPIADPDTQRYTVHLDVAADLEKLIPYSQGEVTIIVAERDDQPLIPRRALMPGNTVFVVKHGRVERRRVEVGFVGLNLVEVAKHLEPGELVIVEELEQFRGGQRVRVVPAK
jgi:RND family efflux transporter MFP subunit